MSALERLTRRVGLMVGIGRTTTPPQDAGPVQMHQLRLSPDGLVRDNIPAMQNFGFSSAPPVGSDVLVLYLGGNRSNGVVLGTLNQSSRFKGLQPGESVQFNAFGMSFVLGKDGVTIDCAGKPMTIKNATKARFECPIESTGEVKAMADGPYVTLSQHKGHTGGGSPPTPNT